MTDTLGPMPPTTLTLYYVDDYGNTKNSPVNLDGILTSLNYIFDKETNCFVYHEFVAKDGSASFAPRPCACMKSSLRRLMLIEGYTSVCLCPSCYRHYVVISGLDWASLTSHVSAWMFPDSTVLTEFHFRSGLLPGGRIAQTLSTEPANLVIQVPAELEAWQRENGRLFMESMMRTLEDCQ